jgi:uncharacterized tellurite resistance protein B-like protein
MWLLDKVRTHLKDRAPLSHDRTGAESDLELRAATAVLLLEAAYGDADYAWREHRAIVKGLEREFGLGRQEILEVIGRANEIRPPVVKLADVVDVIRERLGPEQRAEIVELVRSVIRADGQVEEWEAAFADHIAKAVGTPGQGSRA